MERRRESRVQTQLNKEAIGDNEPPGDNRTFPSRVSADIDNSSAGLLSGECTMSSSNLPTLPSLRRHQLFQELCVVLPLSIGPSVLTPTDSASLQYAAPPGVYVTITPGDPTLWSGVLFVRSGGFYFARLSAKQKRNKYSADL